MIFICLMVLIQHAYELHDTVTGSMILAEVVEEARVDQDEKLDEAVYEDRGKSLGNPRLWLGEYRVELQVTSGDVTGKASAGKWAQEIKMDVFRPGRFLRRMETVKELGKEWDHDENGVQAGNEP